MGRAKAPEFESMVSMPKLKEALYNKGYAVKDVAKILQRESVGNVRSILNGDVALKVGDLTKILDETGIYIDEVVQDEYTHLFKRIG